MYYKPVGDKNPMWKGDDVGYAALHEWIRYHKQKPEFCEECNEQSPIDLANISGEYKRDINDFEWLCRKCHMVKEGRMDKLQQFNEDKKLDPEEKRRRDKECSRKYRKNNIEEIRRKDQERNIKRRVKRNEQSRKRYLKKREEILEQQRVYYNKNREDILKKQKLRRQSIKNGHIWQQEFNKSRKRE